MGVKIYGLVLVGCVCILLSGCGAGVASYDRAMELAQSGDYRQAADYLQKAIEENDERAEFYIGYGMVLNEMGQPEQALKQFKRAYQDTDNSIANANNKQVYYGQAIAYYHLGRYEESLEACEKALKLAEPASLDSNILCSQGVVLEAVGEQDKALKTYKQAVRKDPKNWGAYMKKGELEERLNIVEEAGREYQKVIDGAGREKFEAYFRLYALYLDYGQKEAADKLLTEMIKLKDKDAYALCQKGWAYHYQGDNEKAAEMLGDSLQKGYLGAGYYLGMLELSAQEVDREHVKEYFQGYIDSGEMTYRAQAYNQLGQCALEQQDYENAQQYFSEGLKLADAASRQILWKNLIILLEKRGYFTDAKNEAEKYLTLYSQDESMRKEYRFIKTRTDRTGTATGGAVGSNADGMGETEDSAGQDSDMSVPSSDGLQNSASPQSTRPSSNTASPEVSAVSQQTPSAAVPSGESQSEEDVNATPSGEDDTTESNEDAGMAGYVETVE